MILIYISASQLPEGIIRVLITYDTLLCKGKSGGARLKRGLFLEAPNSLPCVGYTVAV